MWLLGVMYVRDAWSMTHVAWMDPALQALEKLAGHTRTSRRLQSAQLVIHDTDRLCMHAAICSRKPHICPAVVACPGLFGQVDLLVTKLVELGNILFLLFAVLFSSSNFQ